MSLSTSVQSGLTNYLGLKKMYEHEKLLNKGDTLDIMVPKTIQNYVSSPPIPKAHNWGWVGLGVVGGGGNGGTEH